LFGDLEPIRTSQRRLSASSSAGPEFDQAGFVPFTTNIIRTGQSQLECVKRNGEACYDPAVLNPPISYTDVLAKVENNTPIAATNTGWACWRGSSRWG